MACCERTMAMMEHPEVVDLVQDEEEEFDEPLLIELEKGEDYVTAVTSVKTDVCGTCGQEITKYKCPKCGSKNCSLACVNRHKVKTQCDGKFPVVAKVAMRDFNDSTLRREVRFLDHLSQVVERSARVTSRHFSERITAQSQTPWLGKKHLSTSLFRKKCDERQIRLRLCPLELSMRRTNTTVLTRKTKKLSWRVHWFFPHCGKTRIDTS